jgi:two-component system NtrC family sensor kinase
MPYDLSSFNLGDMLKCSPRLRETSSNAPTLEASAQRVCRFLYDELRDSAGDRQCALVRCYKTHPFGSLQPDLQNFARRVMNGGEPEPTMRCLTLMATVGRAAAWNSTVLSKGHRAIPLPSPEIVEKAPMISQLIKEMGLELSNVLQPSPDIVRELAGKRHGVFYVQDASGSPYIPAQDEFVRRFGINSVVGFGGMLPTGDFFSVILFSTAMVTPESADRFKTLALDVKAGFSRFTAANIFNPLGR